jgi:hypothetical protein
MAMHSYFEDKSILIKEKTTAKIAETGERDVCLKIGLSPVSETSPYRVKIFSMK